MWSPISLWTTNQPTRPQTATASWLDISETILHVFVRHFTAVTECTGRKIKILEPSSQLLVVVIISDLQQVTLVNIAGDQSQSFGKLGWQNNFTVFINVGVVCCGHAMSYSLNRFYGSGVDLSI